MIYLGLDLGSKTLGLSISDRTSTIASSLEVIRYNDMENLLNRLDEIVILKKVDAFVLGNPLNLDGSVSKRSEETFEFKKVLESRYPNKKVIMQDEKHDKTWENWFGTIDNQFGLVRYTNKNIQSFEISGKEISINTTDIFTSKTKIIFDLPNKKITFNDNKEFRFTQNPLVQTTYSVYIFSKLRNITASSSGGEIYDIPGSFKLYSFSVKDNNTGEYRYNLIPVLDYNNIPCIYDTVNCNFLYNETDTNLLYKLKE